MSLMDEFLNELEILGLWVSTYNYSKYDMYNFEFFNLSELIEFESSHVDSACTLPILCSMLLSLLCVL